MVKKRVQWSIEQKQEILNHAKVYGNSSAINKYECSESSLYEWKKDERVLSKEKVKGIRKAGGGRKPLLGSSESDLITKIRNTRRHNIKVRPRMVKKWAKEEASKKGAVFKASKGWYWNFLKRNKLKTKSANPKQLKISPEVLSECEKFQWKIIQTERKQRVEWVVNYDETPCMKWMDNGKTLVVDKEDNNKSLNPAGDKNRITITLAAAMNVNTKEVKKAPAFVIFKGKKKPATEGGVILTNRPNVKFTAQEKAWMDRPRMLEYLKEVLIPFLKDLKGSKILTFDNLDSHVFETAQEEIQSKVKDVIIMSLPKNASELMQMCDLTMNRSFKSKFRNLQADWYDEQSELIMKKKREKFPKITKQQLIVWTSRSLSDVPDSVIVNGFKKAGLGLAKDGSEDELVQWKQVFE